MADIERKLATIRKVKEVNPIPGADKIELITVDGWNCIAQKGLYPLGSQVIYCEIDSFLPVRPEFEWLRKSSFKSTKNLGDGFRIKTMKMRGVVSQGLLLPITDFPELMNPDLTDGMVHPIDFVPIFPDHFDVTGILGIQKYEKPIPANLQGKVRGNFPSFIPKTDQERYQNARTWTLERYQRIPFEVSVKLDGSSMTVYYRDGDFGVCSRNMDLCDDAENNFDKDRTSENLFWKAARKYRMRERLNELKMNIAIQGELCGPGIQGNPQKLEDHEFFVYDIYDIEFQRYFTPFERHTFLANYHFLQHVPVTHVGVLDTKLLDRDFILKLAEDAKFHDIPAEGLVFKANDGEFSFKMISPNYLLNEKD